MLLEPSMEPGRQAQGSDPSSGSKRNRLRSGRPDGHRREKTEVALGSPSIGGVVDRGDLQVGPSARKEPMASKTMLRGWGRLRTNHPGPEASDRLTASSGD